MALLTAWAAIWILIHRLISGGAGRKLLVAYMGERPYRLSFALLSIACLAGLAHAYANVKPEGIAIAPWLVSIVGLIQLLAAMLIVAGLSMRNPATAGMGNAAGEPNIVRGMLRVTRHPFLWGILLWSAGHLLVRHDPAAIMFFGSIGAVALMGTWSIDRKRRRALGAPWSDFSRKTSSIPFLAIVTGRQPFVLREIGLGRTAAAFALWFASLWLHPQLGPALRLASPTG